MDLHKRKVFISHNSMDKPFVHRLTKDLREHGVDLWLDENEIGVGDSLIDLIQSAIQDAKFFIVILSNNSMKSKWVKKELNSALSLEIESGKSFVLPVVIDDCEFPLFLHEKLYADFKKGYETGLLQLLKVLIGKKRVKEVVLIPEGSFLYSSQKVKRIIPRSFYIDKIGVTVGDFFRFIQETGYPHPNYDPSRTPLSTEALLPVNFVNVEDAMAYCTWRGSVEGTKVRLPTSEEWEKAARGNDGRIFPWGDEGNMAKQYWYCNCRQFVDLDNRGHQVRQPWDKFPKNVSPYGVYDMVGNVSEWTSSDFNGPHVVEKQPGAGQETRGGAYVLPLEGATCYQRIPRVSFDRVEYIGFRCVTET